MNRFVATGIMLLLTACAEDEIVFGVGSTAAGSGGGGATSSGSGATSSGSGATSSTAGSSGTGGGTGTASGTGGSGGTIGYVPYGPCDAGDTCPGNQTCVKGSPTPTSNVCAPPCMVDTDCPAPPGGTVTPRCYSPGPSCFLWGCGSATCPPGMSCGGAFCVWGL